MFAVDSRHFQSKKKTENGIHTQPCCVLRQSKADGEKFHVTDSDSDSDTESDATGTQEDAEENRRSESPDSLLLVSEEVYSNGGNGSDKEAFAYLGSEYKSGLPVICINSALETLQQDFYGTKTRRVGTHGRGTANLHRRSGS